MILHGRGLCPGFFEGRAHVLDAAAWIAAAELPLGSGALAGTAFPVDRQALAALILLTSQPVALVRENLHPQANRQELKPLAAYLQSHLLPGDEIYVYFHAIYPFKYYYHGNLTGVVWGKSCVETNLELPPSKSGSPQRLWLVASHFRDLAPLRRFAIRLLGPDWREEALLTRQNAALFLFVHRDRTLANLRRMPAKSPQSGTAAPSGERACLEIPPPPRP